MDLMATLLSEPRARTRQRSEVGAAAGVPLGWRRSRRPP